jgi:hypothetical protein
MERKTDCYYWQNTKVRINRLAAKILDPVSVPVKLDCTLAPALSMAEDFNIPRFPKHMED